MARRKLSDAEKELNRQLREIKKETKDIQRSAGGKVYDYDSKKCEWKSRDVY